MELFSLYADGEGIGALFLVHLSDFTTDHSLDHGQVDDAFLERCVVTPEDVRYFFPRGADIFVRQGPRLLLDRQIRRGESSFAGHPCVQPDAHEQGPASHCYSLADHMLD